MHTIVDCLPGAGEKLGLAFSGGLDTRTAVAWLKRRGMSVYAYTADLGQPDEPNLDAVVALATSHGASSARLLDARELLAREGVVAIACGAFFLQTAGRKYFNTTPLGRAVTATVIVRAMRDDGVNFFGDGSTHRGNDIERFFRYGLLEAPDLRIYKPWLDEAFVCELGGRAEMSAYLVQIGLPYVATAEKAYSTDANMLGATHEAKALEDLRESMHLVDPIMGAAFWRSDVAIEEETITVAFERGAPVSLNGARFATLTELITTANHIGGRHGFGMSDQIENRVIGAKSRGIYEAPAMALLHVAYERLLSAIAPQNLLELYETLGRKLGRWLYEGKWFDPEAELVKRALLEHVAALVTGSVTIELRRGDDYSLLRTDCDGATYDAERLSMERTRGAFSPTDRIGQLHVGQPAIDDARTLRDALTLGDVFALAARFSSAGRSSGGQER
jgi:argininosuccinate synthase